MTKKCDKYQALFIFSTKDDLLEHIKICPDCKEEHEQMENVANLVKEVKPYLKKEVNQLKRKLFSQIAASLIIVILSFLAITNYYSYVSLKNDNEEAVALVKSDSIAAQMDLPTDKYGLIDTEYGNDES